MEYPSNWLSDFRETSADLIQDTLLLEAMALLIGQKSTSMTNVPQEILEQTYDRLLDYLFQHTMDLYCLNQRLN